MSTGFTDRPNRTFLDSSVLARLSAVPLVSRRPMVGGVSGRHVSPHRGSSVEFAEYRKYVPGDDLRRLDWRVYGRTDRHYVKEYEADTNLRCCLVVDSSGSMGYGSTGITRMDYARRPEGTSRLPEVLHELAETVRQRALIVIASDLFMDPEELAGCFGHLRFRKHDVAVFHLLDPQELAFDFRRPTRFLDMEGGSPLFADPLDIADRYAQALATHLDAIERIMLEQGVDYHRTQLDENYEKVLARFLVSRASGKGLR